MNNLRTIGATVVIVIVVAAAALAATGAAMRQRNAARLAQQEVERLHSQLARLNDRLDELHRKTQRKAVREPVVAQSAADTPVTPNTPLAALNTSNEELARRDSEILALKAQIAELQQSEPEAAPSEPHVQAAPDERMRQWQERMRERDPEAYERRQAEVRQRMTDLADLTHERLEFMKKVSIDGLEPAYLENHKVLIERLEFFNQAMQQISANPESPEAMTVLPQIMMNMRGLDEMLSMQRTVLLDDLARDIGYEGEDAQRFVHAVTEITEATSMPSPAFFRRGRGGRETAEPAPPLQLP